MYEIEIVNTTNIRDTHTNILNINSKNNNHKSESNKTNTKT